MRIFTQDAARTLLRSPYGDYNNTVLEAAEPLALNAAMGAALTELRTLCRTLEAQGETDRLKLDLSLVNDMEYYNGLVLQGYVTAAGDGCSPVRLRRQKGR